MNVQKDNCGSTNVTIGLALWGVEIPLYSQFKGQLSVAAMHRLYEPCDTLLKGMLNPPFNAATA